MSGYSVNKAMAMAMASPSAQSQCMGEHEDAWRVSETVARSRFITQPS